MLTLALHSPEVHGFFSVPVDHLHALRELAAHFRQRDLSRDEKVSITSIIGDVAGRDVIILDDEIARGTTVLELLSVLRTHEPRSIAIACTHGLFADGALEKLGAAEDVSEIVCTNSVPLAMGHPKLTVLSVAPALAEAIRRTHVGESVSVLFET